MVLRNNDWQYMLYLVNIRDTASKLLLKLGWNSRRKLLKALFLDMAQSYSTRMSRVRAEAQSTEGGASAATGGRGGSFMRERGGMYVVVWVRGGGGGVGKNSGSGVGVVLRRDGCDPEGETGMSGDGQG